MWRRRNGGFDIGRCGGGRVVSWSRPLVRCALHAASRRSGAAPCAKFRASGAGHETVVESAVLANGIRRSGGVARVEPFEWRDATLRDSGGRQGTSRAKFVAFGARNETGCH